MFPLSFLAGLTDADGVTPVVDNSTRMPSPASNFGLLPPELRLNIWSHAIVPRIVILDDLVQKQKSYPMPPVVQVNAEAWVEHHRRYARIARGSFIDFSRDILVCDATLSNQRPDKALEDLAQRIERLAFWDCFPDDARVTDPRRYAAYISAWYRQRRFGTIEFDQFLFSNVKDLWVIKVGKVDPSWEIQADKDRPLAVRTRETARQFRYWRDESIIEIAPLDPDEPDTQAVLRDGRCGREDCRELNRGHSKVVSKVTFVRGPYRKLGDDADWIRVVPRSAKAEKDRERAKADSRNRKRWMMVERILTFSLHCERSDDSDVPLATTWHHAHEGLTETHDGEPPGIQA